MSDRFIDAPIVGVFDSGVGGLSVLRALWKEIPGASTIYFADQVHVPYGPRPLAQVRAFSEEIVRFLIDEGSSSIVVACNAASAAALHHLRRRFPETPFVGMEPAVKPAAESTRSGLVGVLATPATFQGALYASVVERFAQDVQLLPHTCPGLVLQIEAGQLDTPETKHILENAIQPMVHAGIDTIVLGCTHYPFVIPLIQEIAGPGVRVIDPAPAVARQARRFVHFIDQPSNQSHAAFAHPARRFFTTGDPFDFQQALNLLLNVNFPVSSLAWSQGKVTRSPQV